MNASKAANRTRAKNQGLSGAERVSAGEQICLRLIELFNLFSRSHRPDCPKTYWAAYQQHGLEPNLRSALPTIKQTLAIEWVFPRALSDRSCAQMDFYLPQDDKAFLNNAWGLPEPDPAKSTKISPEAISGFIVPGLAFDSLGTRLGGGRGYFDRYFARFDSSQKIKIGVVFDRQLLKETLPSEPHDVAVDIILSESRCLFPGSSVQELDRRSELLNHSSERIHP